MEATVKKGQSGRRAMMRKLVLAFLIVSFAPVSLYYAFDWTLDGYLFEKWREKVVRVFDLGESELRYVWIKSQEYGVDPTFVICQAWVESRFKDDDESYAGAVGWLQVKLSTARIYEPDLTKSDLFVREKNIEVGLKHFAFLLQKYGSYKVAAVAYWLGETRMRTWRDLGLLSYRYYDKIMGLVTQIEADLNG